MQFDKLGARQTSPVKMSPGVVDAKITFGLKLKLDCNSYFCLSFEAKIFHMS